MEAGARSLFVNANLLDALTVWLPGGTDPGEKVDLCFETGVTNLTICDCLGNVVESAPTSADGPGATIIMRYIGRSYGWFYWK
jgi:hypothetical protein